MKKILHPTIFFASVPKRLLVFFCGAMMLLPVISFAQWSTDVTTNNAICTAVFTQNAPELVADGSGGTIIAWVDDRANDLNYDLYAQRIDVNGDLLWTANGVVITTATNQQHQPRLVSDGSGGAVIAWYDLRSGSDYDIYAQRINSSGTVQWTANGVAICTNTPGNQTSAELVSDGSGGAVIAWSDSRTDGSDVYAQRINSAGAVQWTANGVVISAATDAQSIPQLVSDGSGGAVIVWEDYRSGTSSDVYAQRINVSGAVQWTADGVAISTATDEQQSPQLVSDGSGGAVITWKDKRGGSARDIYAQRINVSGAVQWTADGVVISTATDEQENPQLVSDGSGGAVISWDDFRSGSDYDIYAQRINVSGTVQWTANGVVISTATGNQRSAELTSDGSGGAVITWMDLRGGATYDIYAQRINVSGTVQCTADGVAMSTAANHQYTPKIIKADACSFIMTWYDFRGGATYDIYAYRTGCDCAVLPVEWLYFNALAENNSSVRCEWATASEINNNYFAIERSKQGITFEQIGTMQGAGNSSTILNYVYYDDHPYSGVSYYRLRQVDYDGQYEYSPIRAVYIGALEIISIYPNPSSEYIEYTIASETGGPVSLKLIDALGREVLSNTEIVEGGVTSKRLNISTLSSGAYILQITTKTEEKVIKQFCVK